MALRIKIVALRILKICYARTQVALTVNEILDILFLKKDIESYGAIELLGI